MSEQNTEAKAPHGREASALDALVMSLQPCPHCNSGPIDAYQKGGEFGMEYYIVFEKGGCMHCHGKTGRLRIFPLSQSEAEVASKFRVEK